jgi:hypothetical protein
MENTATDPRSLDLPEEVARAAELLFDRKALDVMLLDLRGVSTATDFFLIASGTSDTHGWTTSASSCMSSTPPPATSTNSSGSGGTRPRMRCSPRRRDRSPQLLAAERLDALIARRIPFRASCSLVTAAPAPGLFRFAT